MKPRRLVDVLIALALLAALGAVFLVDRFAAPRSSHPGGEQSLLTVQGVYGLRNKEVREKSIVELGGSKESERAVAAGLEWLARHQAKDGSWRNQHLGPGGTACEKEHPCQGPGSEYAMAQTGLALLAFQASGHYYFNKETHSQNVRAGLDWLVANQRKDGSLHLPEPHMHYMYEHGIAAFALTEACAIVKAEGKPPSAEYLAAARLAIAYIEDQQHDDGGWRYTPEKTERSDASVSGWQILALKSALEAGIDIKPQCVEKVEEFYRSCEANDDGRTGYQGRHSLTDATTGIGMLVHQFLLDKPDSQLVRRASRYLATRVEQEWGDPKRRSMNNYYLWYNCTLAMHRRGGPNWDRWNAVVRDMIVGLQECPKAGCARGSWAPTCSYGSAGGRIYTTALAILTLEVYYRYAKGGEGGRDYATRRTANPENGQQRRAH